MSAPRPLTCPIQASETRSMPTLCYLARLLILSAGVIPSPFLRQKRHESRVHRNKGRRAARGASPFWSAYSARCSPHQPAIAAKAFFWALSLSRLCMRCSLELLALRPRPKPKRRDYQPLAATVRCTTSHQHTQISPVLGEPRTLVLRIIVPRTPHVSPPSRKLQS